MNNYQENEKNVLSNKYILIWQLLIVTFFGAMLFLVWYLDFAMDMSQIVPTIKYEQQENILMIKETHFKTYL